MSRNHLRAVFTEILRNAVTLQTAELARHGLSLLDQEEHGLTGKIEVPVLIETDRPFNLSVALGDILARAHFVYDGEEQRGLVIHDTFNDTIIFDARGVGRVTVKISDISHQMLHRLVGDPHCDGKHETVDSPPPHR